MYLVLARKYRPQRFEDVRGQEHVIRTLKNALRDKKVAHAYLFAGPRGVGKTTVARILSKAVNCEHGISQEPCNECSICREITEGRSVDVAEIDGASHRGIDEVRGLRENAFYPPARTRYKIYIIDEVHMLTKEAFNALLKILEEPPPYLIFIFATTEPHRIPSTILSRCQRFDFRRLTTDEIFTQLYEIKEKEKIEIDDDALKLIAKRADGSLRDAEGMLDQLNTYCGGKITEKDIKEVFGIMDEKFYLDMLNAILDRDDKKIAERITELSRRGVDWGEVTRGLIDFFEKLLHVRLGIEEDELLKPKAERLNEDQILYMLNQVISLERRLKQVPYTTAIVQVELMKLARYPEITRIEELIAKEKTQRMEKPVEKKEEIREEVKEDTLLSVWERLKERIEKNERPAARNIFSSLHPISYDGRVLRVKITEEKFTMLGMDETFTRKFEEHLRAVCGKEVKMEFVVEGKEFVPLVEHEIVKMIKEELDGEVVY